MSNQKAEVTPAIWFSFWVAKSEGSKEPSANASFDSKEKQKQFICGVLSSIINTRQLQTFVRHILGLTHTVKRVPESAMENMRT